MKAKESIAWGKGSLVLSVLALSLTYLSPAFAFSGGATSVNPCSNCHTDGIAEISISGATTVTPDSANEYTLTILDGPLEEGGLNVWAPDGGVLGLVTEGTRLESGEITHSSPQVGDGSSPISWTFSWVAPTVDGVYNLMARAVSANDAGGSGGDWAGMTMLSVTVAAIPIPAAVYLFGSALGLLGWMRRRAR